MALNVLLHDFHFLRPLWLAALLPLAVLLVWLARRRAGEGNWSRLIDADLLASLQIEAGNAVRAASPLPWLALAWLLAVLALAGPAWQRDAAPAFRAPAAWVLVLDLSPSMSAADVSPSRITRARYALDDLLRAARDARVGLIVFSGEPYTVTPLTDDVTTVRALLQPLEPGIMPTPGDALAPALQRAGELVKKAATHDARVIVLTDGFDDPSAALGAAEKLRSDGVKLDVIGVGTASGAPQPQADGGFATNPQGRTQLSRLDADLLRHLSHAGGGTYAELPQVPSLVEDLQVRVESTSDANRRDDVEVSRWRDVGAWLLLPVLLLAALLSRRGWL
ncbi:MAG: vWA domain-containing protein [Panacagrimonas sp.]